MRQSLIRVLQSPARTTVSHYLQIQLGPAPGPIQARPRLTNANQRPDAQLRFFYFITYIQLNIGSPHVVDAKCYACGFGCSLLFVRYRWSVASAVVYDKKKGIWRQHIATSSWFSGSRGLNNQTFMHMYHFMYIYISQRASKQLYLSCTEGLSAAAGWPWCPSCFRAERYSWCQGFVLERVPCNFNVWSQRPFLWMHFSAWGTQLEKTIATTSLKGQKV